MPRAKIEAAFLGWQTVRILAGVPGPQAAWLIKAVCAWILEDREPADEDIPDECIGSWIAIHDESVRIHEARQTDIDNGKKGGRPPKETQGNPKETQGNPKETKSKSKSKSKSTSAGAEETGESTTRACEDFPNCPIPADRLRVLAAHIGATDKEVEDWRNYYTAQEWRFKPVSPRPMTQAAAEASLRNWHAIQGIREAREAHLDAKADERHAAALAARDNRGPAPTDYEALEAVKRRAEAESPVVVGFDENGLAILGKKGMQP